MSGAGEPTGGVNLYVDGEGKLEHLLKKKPLLGRVTDLAALPRGMTSGKASVAIVGALENGGTVLLQTSLRIMLNALTAWRETYGPEADGVPDRPGALSDEELSQRFMSAMVLKLVKELPGGEVTVSLDELNAMMGNDEEVVGLSYAPDGKSMTFRVGRVD